jgi:subtilisin family serine protease
MPKRAPVFLPLFPSRMRRAQIASHAVGALATLLCVGAGANVGLAEEPALPSQSATRPAIATRLLPSPLSVGAVHRAFGNRSAEIFSGRGNQMTAFVHTTRALPEGVREIAPGFGEISGTSETLARLAESNPDAQFEVAPLLKLLTDKVELDTMRDATRANAQSSSRYTGNGTLVAVADTGLDVTHPDFRRENGTTRVAWLLDYSLPPLGIFPELEEKFGVNAGGQRLGAVYDAKLINRLLRSTDENEKRLLPVDVDGHGTHVAGIAAGGGRATGRFQGQAPNAELVIVRLQRAGVPAIEAGDLLRAAQFTFDRADAERKPVALNLSLGTDFGAHDGSAVWEQALAASIGANNPGRAIIAASGNSGSITTPVHQSVHVTGTRVRVPVSVPTPATQAQVQVWLTRHPGATLAIGLESPDGEWIAPIESGREKGKNESGFVAGVVNGPKPDNEVEPTLGQGAIIVWSGTFPAGDYNITIEGNGGAELYLQVLGDFAASTAADVFFKDGVRKSTVNLPADHPSILAVGSTTNLPAWSFVGSGDQLIGPQVPKLDRAGGALTGEFRRGAVGEVSYFSSAGPNAVGVPKPEIMAPGGGVVSAMSAQASPSELRSIFSSRACPTDQNGAPTACLQVDEKHAVSSGTSMASPAVAGVAALLFERNPALTQFELRSLLRGGAHAVRGEAPFFDQSSVGEVDVRGSLNLQALAEGSGISANAANYTHSWLSASLDFVPSDGSLPVYIYAQLRNTLAGSGELLPVIASDVRLEADVAGVRTVLPAATAEAPGLYSFRYTAPSASGGKKVTFRAILRGELVAEPITLPIESDPWTAGYRTFASGGCNAIPTSAPSASAWSALAIIAVGAMRRTRRVARKDQTKADQA